MTGALVIVEGASNFNVAPASIWMGESLVREWTANVPDGICMPVNPGGM
jgi:hypothetical protein